MDESVFYTHYRFAVNELIDGVECSDPEHDILHPFFDFDTEKVQFVCLSCEYKVTPGLDMYDRMRSEVERVSAELVTELWNPYE